MRVRVYNHSVFWGGRAISESILRVLGPSMRVQVYNHSVFGEARAISESIPRL